MKPSEIQKLYENQNLTEEEQTCISCQLCCKEMHTHTQYLMNDEQATEFFRARGFIIENHCGKIKLRMQIPCPHLGCNGCNIYENRPEVCRAFNGEALGDLCPLNKKRGGLL